MDLGRPAALSLEQAPRPPLGEAWRGYRRALSGRYASGEELIRAAIGKAEGADPDALATARLLLGLSARCRADWEAATEALQAATRGLPPEHPVQELGLVVLADAWVQAGRLEELRVLLEGSSASFRAPVADLANATLRFGLGQSQEALELVRSARKAGLPESLGRWAVALEAELLIEGGDHGPATALLEEHHALEPERGFDETAVRLLVVRARAVVEDRCFGERVRASRQDEESALRVLSLAEGYGTNMPLYQLSASAMAGLLDYRRNRARGVDRAVRAAEALASRGSPFEAARVLGRVAALQVATSRALVTPVIARARDLFARSGGFARLTSVSSLEADSKPPTASMAAPTAALGATTYAGGSIIGLQLEKDVELNAVFEVARELTASRRVDELLQRIVQSAVRVLKADRGALIRRWPDGRLECVAAQGVAADAVREGSNEISFGVVRECERTEAAVLSDNAITDARFKTRGSVLAADLRSIACAPLKTAKQRLGFLYLDSSIKARAFTPLTRELLAVFAAQAAVAMENALAFEEIDALTRNLEEKVQERTRELAETNRALQASMEELKSTRLAAAEAQRDALEKEMHLARDIQLASVPPRGRITTPVATLAGSVEPASFCGGDFWAQGSLPGERMFLLVGDVTGHGVGAALMTAVAKSCLDTLLSTGAASGPAEFLRRLNEAIFASGKGELMMTAWMGVLDKATRTLTFANAAHNLPYYLDLSQGIPKVDVCAARGDPLGEEAEAEYTERKLSYQPGGVLVLYSDGLVECTNDADQQWGEKRLRRLLAEQTDFDPEALHKAITGAAWQHYGGHPRDDDVTVVIAVAH